MPTTKHLPPMTIVAGDLAPGSPNSITVKASQSQQYNSGDGLNYVIKIFNPSNPGTPVAVVPVLPLQPGVVQGSSLPILTYIYFVYSPNSTRGAQHTIIITSGMRKKKRKVRQKPTRKKPAPKSRRKKTKKKK